MTMISLDDNWQCAYAPTDSGLPLFTDAQPVVSLERWTMDRQRVAWLRRVFELEPTDYCVNYVLHVDVAPTGTRLYLNGEMVGDLPDSLPYEVDITLHVALGENEILFRVEPGAAGRFRGVALQPVPCD